MNVEKCFVLARRKAGEDTPLKLIIVLLSLCVLFDSALFWPAMFSLTPHRLKLFVCKMHCNSLSPAVFQDMGWNLGLAKVHKHAYDFLWQERPSFTVESDSATGALVYDLAVFIICFRLPAASMLWITEGYTFGGCTATGTAGVTGHQ